MTPLQKLEKILWDSQNDYFGYFNRFQNSKITDDELLSKLVARRIEAKQQLANWFIETLKECLGEKEKPDVQLGTNSYIYSVAATNRNEFREQTLATAYKVMEVKK